MTDKHIPASKLLALPQYGFYGMAGALDSITPVIKADDLSALIDEAPEVEPVAYAEQDDIDMHDYAELSFSYPVSTQPTENRTAPLYASPPPSPDLTKLVGELVEALGEVHWLVSSELPKHLDKDQLLNLDAFRNKLTLLLTRAKEYLK